MNATTSGPQTSDGMERAGSDGMNPYVAQAQAWPAQAQLDATAPQLKSNDMQRMNRSAMFMIIALVILLVVGITWIVLSPSASKSTQLNPQREETVRIPEAPQIPETPVSPKSAIAQAPESAQAIPLAPPRPPSRDPELRTTQVPQPHVPTLVERRMTSASGESSASPVEIPSSDQGTNGLTDSQSVPGTSMNMGMNGLPNPYYLPSNAAYGGKLEGSKPTNATHLIRQDNLMLRGTYIRCVLETRVITDIPGFASCIVTEPVYSFTGKQLLLPKGSKVLGKYEQEPNGSRVAIIWDRVVTPDGVDVTMASPGIDNLGGAGHPGNYNAHWVSRISSALFISLLSDAFKYEAAKEGPTSSTVASNGTVVQQPFESNTAQTIQDLANQAVRRSANRPATVTINQGTVVTIYVSKDVDFSGVIARH